MMFAEVLIIVGLVAAGGLGIGQFARWRAEVDHNKEEALEAAKRALASDSHKRIEDCLIVYGDLLPAKLRSHLSTRRDELYIEKNS